MKFSWMLRFHFHLQENVQIFFIHVLSGTCILCYTWLLSNDFLIPCDETGLETVDAGVVDLEAVVLAAGVVDLVPLVLVAELGRVDTGLNNDYHIK